MALALAIGAWSYLGLPKTSSPSSPAQNIATPAACPSAVSSPSASTSANLVLDNLTTNQLITSPMTITGKARSWYFEAVFPVKIYDGNNQLLGQTQAQAQSDWMTSEFMPFKATLTFNSPNTESGFIILAKDNPSGLTQNAEQVIIPVKFR